MAHLYRSSLWTEPEATKLLRTLINKINLDISLSNIERTDQLYNWPRIVLDQKTTF